MQINHAAKPAGGIRNRRFKQFRRSCNARIQINRPNLTIGIQNKIQPPHASQRKLSSQLVRDSTNLLLHRFSNRYRPHRPAISKSPPIRVAFRSPTIKICRQPLPSATQQESPLNTAFTLTVRNQNSTERLAGNSLLIIATTQQTISIRNHSYPTATARTTLLHQPIALASHRQVATTFRHSTTGFF